MPSIYGSLSDVLHNSSCVKLQGSSCWSVAGDKLSGLLCQMLLIRGFSTRNLLPRSVKLQQQTLNLISLDKILCAAKLFF